MLESKKSIAPGTKFLKLTTTGRGEYRKLKTEKRFFYECKCDCGNVVWISKHNLGHTISCGCASKIANKKRAKHNKTNERIYRTWINMRERCNNPKDKSYKIYGGRGIKVCDEWDNSFEKFYEDMGEIYELHIKEFGEKDTTIDRIDVNGNYCKENCRWATHKEQTKNQRKYKHGHWAKEYGFTLQELANKYGVTISYIQWRLYHKCGGNMDKLMHLLDCQL